MDIYVLQDDCYIISVSNNTITKVGVKIYKSFLFAAAFSVCSLAVFAAPAFADASGALIAGSDGIDLGATHGLDAKYPVNPETGMRLGLIDWEGMGRDISRHPDGAYHDPAMCGMCK